MCLTIIDWGLIDYEQAYARQLELVEQVYHEQSPGFLVFCSHPEVVTLGRKTAPSDLCGWAGKTIEVNRGGRATYHGPSQLVIYPIYNLKHSELKTKQDIGWYMRSLERAMIDVLALYDIKAYGKLVTSGSQKAPSASLEDTGVWIEGRKIASLGVGVRHWITFHGMALNVFQDPLAFQGLRPCGYEPQIMISLEALVGVGQKDRDQLMVKLKSQIAEAIRARLCLTNSPT